MFLMIGPNLSSIKLYTRMITLYFFQVCFLWRRVQRRKFSVCMYVCVYVYKCVYVCMYDVYMYVYVCICVCVCMYDVCMYICMYV